MHSGNTERNIIRGFILLMTVLTGSIAVPVSAGDEDMNPTAYQQFDPVTGYMIPIENPPQNQQGHNSATSTQASGEQQQAAAESITGAPAESTTASTSAPTSSSPSFWVYLLAAIVIIGGLAAWIRRGTRSQPGNLD